MKVKPSKQEEYVPYKNIARLINIWTSNKKKIAPN